MYMREQLYEPILSNIGMQFSLPLEYIETSSSWYFNMCLFHFIYDTSDFSLQTNKFTRTFDESGSPNKSGKNNGCCCCIKFNQTQILAFPFNNHNYPFLENIKVCGEKKIKLEY